MFRSNRPEPAGNDQAKPMNPQPVRPSAEVESRPQPVTSATSNTTNPSLAQPAPPRAVSETESLARDIKDGLVGGFVGVHSIVSGEANFKGMLRVDGRVSGRINSQDGTLIVSAGGQVDADVAVAVAKINGTVNGDIRATTRIELGRTAQVNGNVQTPALVIEQGAIFEGSCRMRAQASEPEPAKQNKPTQPRAETTTSARSNAPAVAASKESKLVPPPVARATPQAEQTAAPIQR
jgi:cytoskeletal protein CcmA (bactofilin family)